MTAVLDDCVKQVGRGRVGSLHLNDSQTPLGSNRDRHANVGDGELGRKGCSVVPLRAALRRAAVRPRDARPGAHRPEQGGDHALATPAQPGLRRRRGS